MPEETVGPAERFRLLAVSPDKLTDLSVIDHKLVAQQTGLPTGFAGTVRNSGCCLVRLAGREADANAALDRHGKGDAATGQVEGDALAQAFIGGLALARINDTQKDDLFRVYPAVDFLPDTGSGAVQTGKCLDVCRFQRLTDIKKEVFFNNHDDQ